MGSLFKNVWLPSPSSDNPPYDLDPSLVQPLLDGDATKEVIGVLPKFEKCELRVQGMTCGACVEAIEGMLRNQQGISSIKVALLAERAAIEFDPTHWTVPKLVDEISDIGFDATLIPSSRNDVVQLRVYGMTCSACTNTVESGLLEVPGITSASVSLATETCTVRFDRALVSPRYMVERIEEMGFDAILADQENATQLQSLTRMKEVMEWRSRFLWSLVFSIPLFFLHMVGPRIPGIRDLLNYRLFHSIYLGDLLMFLITTPAQFWIGDRFYRNAFKSLKHGSATMDVLVVLGTSAAYTYSVSALFFAAFDAAADHRPHLFFETSTMLLSFVSLGRYLENKAKGRTSAALTDLMALAPSMATIYTDSTCTQEKKIATELVEVGDTVKIVPGDKIPADGTVIKGSSSVDESAITGEAVPVSKLVGDSVIGGTVNGLGTFDMLVTRAGKDTSLSQIVRLVEEAQTSKAPIQAFADRVAGYFVPAVIGLAVITLISWILVSTFMTEESLPAMFHNHGSSKFAVCLQMCISVVVVACPCALGLATPTAIMVGTGMGAQNGILIKGGRALEASKSIKRIVLDKTGTVTAGKLSVVGVNWVPKDDNPNDELYAGDTGLEGVCADGVTKRKDIIAMICATETRSEHPLAKAIATYGRDMLGAHGPQVEVIEFESVTGQGVKATIRCQGERHALLIGNASFTMRSSGADSGERLRSIPTSLINYEKQETKQGRSIIFVSLVAPKELDHPQVILAVSLADAPKPSSKPAIRALENMGIEVNMMTGDSKATAVAVAMQVGIRPEGVWAAMSPKGKAAMITELMEKHGTGIAMVGDGINDSPALVAATVGIALSSGTSVAIEAADIVLMRSDLLDVVAALHLSRKIFSVIRRNLIWACIYNVVGIPLAMGIFLPFGLYMHPMLAGAAMAFSSVSVVTSSLTLRWWRRPTDSVMPGEVLRPAPSGFISTPSGGLTPWTGMFLDSAASVLDSARVREIGGLFGVGRDTDGYSQLPVEMESRTTLPVFGSRFVEHASWTCCLSKELMGSSENLRDRLTLSPKRVGSVFLGDIQRHQHFATSSSRASSAQSTPTSSPPNTASIPGVFAFHHSHGRRSTRSSLDDIDIDMDPPEPVKQINAPRLTPGLRHDGGGNKPGKIDPVLALELRLRWLEALILGIKQDLGRERKGKGKDGAEYASFGNAQTIASANLKRGETLMRLGQNVQDKLDKALEGNEGLKRFMDNYDQHAHLLTPAFALSGILPDPPTYDKMTPEEMSAFLTEMEPDIRAADRDMLEIDALEKKGVLGSGKLRDQEKLQPRLQALLTSYEEDVKLAASLEARISSLVQRHGSYTDTLSELFVVWDDTISEAEDKLSRMEHERAEKMRLGLS